MGGAWTRSTRSCSRSRTVRRTRLRLAKANFAAAEPMPLAE